ncbi:MAG TPA: hypothetical protein VJH92_00750 [Candidatus Nanoarchaeia archaeon]|nr:hypothetical protein [Candidatus Nanoarchaeia archaeon]
MSESIRGKEKIRLGCWNCEKPAGCFHAIFVGGKEKNRPSATEMENRNKLMQDQKPA